MHFAPLGDGSQESKCNSASSANTSGRISTQNLNIIRIVWQNKDFKFTGMYNSKYAICSQRCLKFAVRKVTKSNVPVPRLYTKKNLSEKIAKHSGNHVANFIVFMSPPHGSDTWISFRAKYMA